MTDRELTRQEYVDPLIDEVRQRRRGLLSSCHDDLGELLLRIQEQQRLHPEKIEDRRARRAIRTE